METNSKDGPGEGPEPGAGRMRVGIAYNLKHGIASGPADAEAEYDDFNTILAIRRALEAAGYAVELYEATEDLPARLLQRRPDIVFNIAEGLRGRGREAQIPAILNHLNIPFTGSDETTLCIAMDKALAKRLLASYGVRTPKYRVFGPGDAVSVRGMAYPLIVKPDAEGSSKGITSHSVVNDAAELRTALQANFDAYQEEMLVEEYIAGREFTVGILGNGGDARVFAPMEIVFKEDARRVYSYEVKKNYQQYIAYRCPPDLSAEGQAEMMGVAMRIYKLLGCRDCARIDFRLAPEGQLHFIEINPLPGLAPGYSDFPMLAEFCGVGYDQLIRGILDSALKRCGLPIAANRG